MRFGLTAEQRQFGAVAAELLAKPDTDRWAALTDLGVPAVLVPEEHGGLGGDEIDLLPVLEEAGRAALPDPLVESLVATRLLTALGGSLAAEWLPQIASGESLVLFADGPYLPHADRAALILTERDGALCTATPGEPQPSTDPARRLHSTASTTPMTADALGAVEPGPPRPSASSASGAADMRSLLAEARDRGAALTAVYLVGLARRMIDMAVEYTCERTQFGRPVGSFQAVKHHLANALVAVEFARPPAYRAAYSLARGSRTASRDASMAKAMASEAALQTARAALQVHGAIGYTLEYDLHHWLRRAWTLSTAWGTPTHHHRRVATALLNTEATPERLP
ncbi:acyl-CoA dehydrogenase family protein [Thermomonospora cellulosilytica]|uniref:Alkylation response protein AidB-like acyl-CoA dehydrogenase n=1 Tax=Thermomonospora cellulosilytica TaxID=1411118 RepID=A0A7W3MTJ3_9ACTN|nr:acyl-CoA dehydrogenase [Thermomonospora cellulosilytica]MBA9001641.1 alkylation response protein AidB-like acyl-CoA dehydrogenase [Thermomonospora cellulosilytica]